MKVVLVQQSDPLYGAVKQIPTGFAQMQRAASDVQSLKGMGVEFGLNGAGAMDYSFAHLDPLDTLTSLLRANTLEPEGAPDYVEGSVRHKGTLHPSEVARWDGGTDTKWFCLNVEGRAVVESINRFGDTSATVTVNSSTQVDLPWLKTTTAARLDTATWRMTKKIMKEVAVRNGLEFAESSPTTLRLDGLVHVPTYRQVFDALAACQVEMGTWVRQSSNGGPGWTGRIINDWRHGIAPAPFQGSGWFTSPSTSGYYVPQHAAVGAGGSFATTGSPHQFRFAGTNGQVATWSPGSTSPLASMAGHVAQGVDKAFTTARNAARLASSTDSTTVSWYFEVPTHHLSQVDPFMQTSGQEMVPVGFQGIESGWRHGDLLLPKDAAKQVIKHCVRTNWLASFRHLGRRTGIWLNGSFGFNYANTPFWGLTSTDADLKECILDPLFEPVTQQEVDRFGLSSVGITAGRILSGGTIVVWNAASFYLQQLFTNDPSAQPVGPHPNARSNMILRATARGITTPPDWSRATVYPSNGGPSTNPWFNALSVMLTDDLVSRCEVIRKTCNDAMLRGAARRTTVQSLS